MASKTFASALGQVVWLMCVSKDHRDRTIASLDSDVLTALLLKQFKLYFKGEQPVAFVAWAEVTDDARAKLERGESLSLTEWRGGEHLEVVECISPFADPGKVTEEFLASMSK